MNRKEQCHKVFTVLRESNPNPTTELVYTTPYELLVAVVLSAQATDVGVNKATKLLYKIANTPQQMSALNIEIIEENVKTINFFRAKAKNILKLSLLLIEKFNSEVPSNFDDLVTLPGVGRKTANVILNTLHKLPMIAVDTHVFRVANRLGIAKGETPLEVELKLIKNIPAEFKVDSHHWLILHGRYICKARIPQCQNCVINHLCDYFSKLNK